MNNRFSKYSWAYIIIGLLFGGCGLLFRFGAEEALIGNIYVALGVATAIIGLILPGKLGEIGVFDCGPVLIMFLPILVDRQLNALLVGIVVGVLLVGMIGGALMTRKRTQQELRLMWQLADQQGYDATEVQKLATFKRNQYRYQVADWAQTRGSKPQFYPNIKAVRLVITKLS